MICITAQHNQHNGEFMCLKEPQRLETPYLSLRTSTHVANHHLEESMSNNFDLGLPVFFPYFNKN